MYKRILTAVILMSPAIAFAQDIPEGGIGETVKQIQSLLNFFLAIALPLAIAFFFWGLIKYIRNAENADLKKDGQKMMINAGIALFLMVGIWSILGYLQSSAGLGGQQLVVEPAPSITDVIPQ